MEPSISDFSNSPGSEAKPVSIDGNQSTPRLTIRFKVGQKTESQCQIRSRESVTSQFDQVAGVLGHYSCKLCLAQSDLSELTLKPMHPIMVSFTDSDKIGLKDEHERRKDGCRGERKSTTLEKTTKHTQQEPVRALCTKKFPLLKAQFGRMRCHPKRDWRGIQPPEKPVLAKKNERNLQVKNSSNGAQMNSVESLSYHTNSTITEESSKEHYPLPPLSNWLVTGSGTRKNKTARSESKDLQRQRFEGVSKSIKQTELGFLKKQETDKESLESDPKKSEILHESFLVYRRGQWKKKTEEKREARAIQTATNSGTPQEGEISSNCHDSKKRKLFIGGSAANNSEEEEVSQEDVQVSGIGSEISVAFLKVSCNQWFNSGQALGGHMRKHFDRKKHLAKLKAHHSSKRLTMGSQVELGGERKNGEGERRNEERMGAMDLNGVKPIEDEDLKFAISMLEVVPAYAGYVRSRLFMIFEA
ncbi:hypothetical protein AMTRI_Chr10g228980 [Amborella trichopoda]